MRSKRLRKRWIWKSAAVTQPDLMNPFADVTDTLFCACGEGRLDDVEQFLRCGEDVNQRLWVRDRWYTPLHLACIAGRAHVVDYLLRCGADAQLCIEESPLHVAAARGDADIAQRLLDRGANANQWDADRRTPFFAACEAGRTDVARLLLGAHGASLALRDYAGETALHAACRRGVLSCVEMCIDRADNVDVANHNRETPFHVACMHGHLLVAKLLLSRGCNMRLLTRRRETALHFACMSGNAELVQYLFSDECQSRRTRRGLYRWDVNAKDRDGCTPLMVAAEVGSMDVMRVVVDHGGRRTTTDRRGYAPLHYAIESDNEDVALFVARSSTGHMIDAATTDGDTPLHLASMRGMARLVRFLLDKNANVHAENARRTTPLFNACQRGATDCIQALLQRGATVSHSVARAACMSADETCLRMILDRMPAPYDMRQLLHVACARKNPRVVRMLLDHGCDANAPWEGVHPIVLACSMHGDPDIVRILMERGASCAVVDAHGYSPLARASIHGFVDVARVLCPHASPAERDAALRLTCRFGHGSLRDVLRVLLSHGARVNAADQHGRTPLHFAATTGREDADVIALLEFGANVHRTDAWGNTPLHCAAGRSGACVPLLLAMRADPFRRNRAGAACREAVSRALAMRLYEREFVLPA